MKTTKTSAKRVEIHNLILEIRSKKVIVDADLARLYGVPTRVLNQAVRRNRDRFPQDFMFTLTSDEKAEVITICDHLSRLKFSASLPNVFTEHGVVMAATVLKTPRAIQISIFVVRAFVELRERAVLHSELIAKINELERRVGAHDQAIQSLITAIRQLIMPTERGQRSIGFSIRKEKP